MERQELGTTWLGFWAGPPNVPGLIFEHLKHKDKKGLRGTSAHSRTAVNAGVRKAVISNQDDLQRLEDLQLHERFPNLASIKLKDGDKCPGAQVVRSIVDFVFTTLSKLPSLSSVDLTRCEELDATGAALALASCTNLQELLMPYGAKVTNVTLQLLAQITSLTSLELYNNSPFDTTGLQHLSALRKLESLQCQSCDGITDASVAAVAQLKGLTSLDLHGCEMQGTTLAQLSALSNLKQLSLPNLHDPQHRTALQSLTNLTQLNMPKQDAAITDACKSILELPALQQLDANYFELEAAPTASMCSQLKSLTVYTFTPSLARMLPLPELRHLHIQDTLPEDEMPGLELAAAIATQTSLTSLDMYYLDRGLSDDNIVTMVTPLKKLQKLSLTVTQAAWLSSRPSQLCLS